MSKQPNADLSNMTAEQSRKKYCLQEKTSLGGSEGNVLTLQELAKRGVTYTCDDLGRLGKISDVEQKWSRLGEILTLQELLTEGVGWFTIKPAVMIVALGRRRYSHHRCVDRLLEERGPEHRRKIWLR